MEDTLQLTQRCQDHRAKADATSNLLFVGGLALEATEQDLVIHFSKFGVVTSARIQRRASGKSKGFAYLQMLCSVCAQHAVVASPQIILGSVITVQRALSMEQKRSLHTSKMTRKLFVSRIPLDFHASVLAALFSCFGEVESVTQVKSKPLTATKSCLIIMKDAEIANSIRKMKRIAIPNRPALFVKPFSSGSYQNPVALTAEPSKTASKAVKTYTSSMKQSEGAVALEDSQIPHIPGNRLTKSGSSTDGDGLLDLLSKEQPQPGGWPATKNAGYFLKLRPGLHIFLRTDAHESIRGLNRNHVFVMKSGRTGQLRSAASAKAPRDQPEPNLVFNIRRF